MPLDITYKSYLLKDVISVFMAEANCVMSYLVKSIGFIRHVESYTLQIMPII